MQKPSSDLIPVLNKLRGVKRGSGETWTALCPSHPDKTRSLSITEKDGKLLLHCFVSCSFEQIMAALGLSPSVFATPHALPEGTPEELIYVIRDRQLHTLAEHVRLDYPDGSKRFIWRRDGKVGLQGLKLTGLPLYGIHDLPPPVDPFESSTGLSLNSQYVIIVEGEKACDSLKARGIPAVSTYGANCIPDTSVLAELFGYVIFLWPDNDEPGRKHMELVARNYPNSDCPFIIQWSAAPPKGDAADFTGDVGELLGNATLWEPGMLWEPSDNVPMQEAQLGRFF